MNRYKVGFLNKYPDLVSYIHVKAEDETGARRKIEKTYPVATITSVRKTMSNNEWILDMWYYFDREGYLMEWNPNITTRQMVNKLRKSNPKLWRTLSA